MDEPHTVCLEEEQVVLHGFLLAFEMWQGNNLSSHGAIQPIRHVHVYHFTSFHVSVGRISIIPSEQGRSREISDEVTCPVSHRSSKSDLGYKLNFSECRRGTFLYYITARFSSVEG